MIRIEHVNADIKHDGFATESDANTGATHILPRPQTQHLNTRCCNLNFTLCLHKDILLININKRIST